MISRGDVEYRVSARARYLRVTMKSDGRVVVSMPRRVSRREAERFVGEKWGWIEVQMERLRKRVEGRASVPAIPKDRMKEVKKMALGIVNEKLEQLNRAYGFIYHRVSIKNQRTRWGSCSRKGNLNFNIQIVALSEDLAEYLVAHELCHLKEMNHSKRFWDLVAKTIPDFRERRRELKRLHLR